MQQGGVPTNEGIRGLGLIGDTGSDSQPRSELAREIQGTTQKAIEAEKIFRSCVTREELEQQIVKSSKEPGFVDQALWDAMSAIHERLIKNPDDKILKTIFFKMNEAINEAMQLRERSDELILMMIRHTWAEHGNALGWNNFRG